MQTGIPSVKLTQLLWFYIQTMPTFSNTSIIVSWMNSDLEMHTMYFSTELFKKIDKLPVFLEEKDVGF